jgi:hypothetical protein
MATNLAPRHIPTTAERIHRLFDDALILGGTTLEVSAYRIDEHADWDAIVNDWVEANRETHGVQRGQDSVHVGAEYTTETIRIEHNDGSAFAWVYVTSKTKAVR